MSFSSLLPPPQHSKDKDPEDKDLEAISAARSLIKPLLSGLQQRDDDPIATMLDAMPASKISFQDFIPLRQRNFKLEIPMPSQEEINETRNRTKEVFDKLLQKQISSHSSTAVHNKPSSSVITRDDNRRLEIVERKQDPLQPTRNKFKKTVAPVATEDVEVPIFHQVEEKKLTKEERAKWNIPSAVSNWKNPNGYTVSLEKRLQMDGRFSGSSSGQVTNINDKHMELSDALEKVDKEARRELAQRALQRRHAAEQEANNRQVKLEALKDKIRGTGNKVSKKSTVDRLKKLAYSRGEDISDKVALAAVNSSKQPDLDYDSRLFTKGGRSKKSESQVYDNPLFVQQDTDNIYRAKAARPDDNAVEATVEASVRRGPVEFTRATTEDSKTGNSSADSYGLKKQ
ncbi:hypothetical protein NCAS_0B05150 [Naumovozyma castellii]|uniref:Pre-mRNA-processing protein 45 n=1 Tax=Naumovozyma castellii TaxID=27288 RepID=G0V9I3_NAUCA|nr:hypothetical protein NCAS_0B05150 [Naumovozyma castellii CBS 4309]CCC68599.1 hypothetical protein NCAS_0B05150 [Naumovozyma castellii CBS 4309]